MCQKLPVLLLFSNASYLFERRLGIVTFKDVWQALALSVCLCLPGLPAAYSMWWLTSSLPLSDRQSLPTNRQPPRAQDHAARFHNTRAHGRRPGRDDRVGRCRRCGPGRLPGAQDLPVRGGGLREGIQQMEQPSKPCPNVAPAAQGFHLRGIGLREDFHPEGKQDKPREGGAHGREMFPMPGLNLREVVFAEHQLPAAYSRNTCCRRAGYGPDPRFGREAPASLGPGS